MKNMKMTRIENIWKELESTTSIHYGLLYKRYAAEIIPDIFIALKSIEKLRCIAIKIRCSLKFDVNQWNKFKEIRLETFPDEHDKSKVFLLILLIDKQHKDIFATLCEDLINGVTEINDELILIERLLERLSKWQSLFEKISKEGLSDDAQRGLYGEVFFLRFFLNNSNNQMYCIKSWLGPEKSIQDFQNIDWAVEVKTTHGNNHQKINITSERQLDDSIIQKLFLYHLSLDVRVGQGETLNSLIDNVTEILSPNTIAKNIFRFKLLESGYFDIHRSLYEDTGYSIRQENIYRVYGNFPRITEKQIPKGVGDVKYSIVLNESEEWRINHNSLLSEISHKEYGKQ